MNSDSRGRRKQLGHLVAIVLLVLGAGTVAALGGIPVVLALLAILGVFFLSARITRLEHFITLIFVGAMFYKAIAIAADFWYFPVVFDAFLASAALAAVLRRASAGRPKSLSLIACVGWWLFFGTAVVQLVNPNIPSPLAAANGFRVTAFEAVAFWIGTHAFQTDEDLQSLFKWMLPFALIVLANGIRQLILPVSFDTRFIEIARSSPDVFELTGQGLARRAFSIFPSPFTLGYFGALMAVLAWYMASVTRQRWYWLAAGISIFGGLASLTRSTLYALLAAFSVVFVFSRTGFLRRAVQVTSGIILGSATVLLLGHFVPTIAIFLAVSRSPLTEPHFLDRLATWHEVWPMLLKHPILGYGVGSGGDALADLYFGTESYHIVPHNVLLKLLLELGIVGTIGFVLLVSSSGARVIGGLRSGDRSVRLRGAMLLGCFAAILVQGITGSAIEAYPTNMYFWFLVGIAARVPSGTPPRLARLGESRDSGSVASPTG